MFTNHKHTRIARAHRPNTYGLRRLVASTRHDRGSCSQSCYLSSSRSHVSGHLRSFIYRRHPLAGNAEVS